MLQCPYQHASNDNGRPNRLKKEALTRSLEGLFIRKFFPKLSFMESIVYASDWARTFSVEHHSSVTADIIRTSLSSSLHRVLLVGKGQENNFL